MQDEYDVGLQKVEINAVSELELDSEIDTRTVLDENYQGGSTTFLWTSGESLGVFSTSTVNSRFTCTNSTPTATATFTGALEGKDKPKYAYYPYSANAGTDPANLSGELPMTQKFSTADRRLYYDWKVGSLKSGTKYQFNFRHLFSMMSFQVNAANTSLAGQKLESISIKVTRNGSDDVNLAGKFTFSAKSIYTAATSVKWTEKTGNQLVMEWTDQPELVDDPSEVYIGVISCAPSIKAGDLIEFTVKTDTHIATFQRESKKAFQANTIYNYPLILDNFDDGDDWVVVERDDVGGEDPDTPVKPEEPVVGTHPVLYNFKFTVDDNPGKILSRRFTHNSSFAVTVSNVSEEKCEVDTVERTVSAYIPYINNRNLIPTFEIPEGTVLMVGEQEVTSGVTSVDFTGVNQISVVNEVGEEAVYDFNLTNTGLPVVVINQETGTTSSETNSKYTKASAAWYKATGTKWQPKESDWLMTEGKDNFMIYNADGTSALLNKDGAVVETAVDASTRVRGNVTQQMPKKPFAVKLDKKHAISIVNADGTKSEMPAHKRWVLLANWKDRTLMRNEVAFGIAEVFKKTFPNDGMAWNPSGEFVELVYNGVYVGNYYLCEQVKIDENRLDINDPYDVEDAYSGNPADYGYLLESDDAYDETWKFTTACYVPFLFKDDGNDAMLTYASEFVRGIEDNLYKNTTAGYTAAFAKMDLASFVDFWLIQELMMNSETQHPKSCYSYINNGIMYAGPIWDFDWNTLPVSSSYSEEGYSYSTSMITKASPYHKRSGYPDKPNNESDANYLWYPMLVKSSQFKNLAAERWNAVSGAVQTYVSIEIPKVKAAIATSEAENNKMWPVDSKSGWIGPRYNAYGIGGGYCGDENKPFNDAVSTMQSTLNSRINGMNSFVSGKNWPSKSYSNR